MLLLGAALVISTRGIKKMAGIAIGSDFMPLIAAIMLVIFGVIMLVNGYKKLKENKAFQNERNKEEEKIEFNNIKAPIICIALLGLYIGLLDSIGFIIMTTLYLFLQMLALAPKQKRNYVLFGIISVVTTLGVYYVFVYGFSLMLPVGILG